MLLCVCLCACFVFVCVCVYVCVYVFYTFAISAGVTYPIYFHTKSKTSDLAIYFSILEGPWKNMIIHDFSIELSKFKENTNIN